MLDGTTGEACSRVALPCIGAPESACDCLYCCGDYSLCALFAIDPEGVSVRWLELYQRRTRLGPNTELQLFTDTILALVRDGCELPRRPTEKQDRRDATEALKTYGVHAICELALAQDDFYREDPVSPPPR